MRWAGHKERMKEMRNSYNILVGKPETDQSEDLRTDGKIILNY
jgi:hypothetical protein